MPLQLPVLDDRNYEQLLEDAKRRIPAHTPEWTNFDVESDPGITLVQLFAFLTDNLLYRANRIPERNRLKFLQLLGIPLQPATAAQGLVAIRNDRGPVQAVTLAAGVAVLAGNVRFLTRSGLTVLPVEGQVYYKKPVDPASPRHADLARQFDALRQARLAQAAAAGGAIPEVELRFYETTALKTPTASEPNPLFDLIGDTLDGALYIALLAPKNVPLDTAREAIAHKTLSIGVVPALADDAPPLLPQTARRRTPAHTRAGLRSAQPERGRGELHAAAGDPGARRAGPGGHRAVGAARRGRSAQLGVRRAAGRGLRRLSPPAGG
ncbi:MAG: hypothetical protein V9H69_24790 [Anaerolineae bacterium]